MQLVDVQLHYATDYKLDRFVNGPLIRFLNRLAHFKVVLSRNQAEWFESWPNGLEVQ